MQVLSVGTNLDYINKRDEERKAIALEKANMNEKANKEFNDTVISIVEGAEQEDELDFLDSSIIDMYTSTLSMVEIKDTLDYSVSSLSQDDVIITEKVVEEQIEMEVHESDLEDEEIKFSNLTNQELYDIVAKTLNNAEMTLENDLDFASDLNEAIYALENRSSIEYKNSDIVKAVKLTIRELRTIDREINPTAILNTIKSILLVIEKRAIKGDFLSTIKAFNENKEGEYIDKMFEALASM